MLKNLGLLVRVPMIILVLVTALACSGVSHVAAYAGPVDQERVNVTGQGCPNPDTYRIFSYAHSGGWAIYSANQIDHGYKGPNYLDGGQGSGMCDGSFAEANVASTETAQYRWHVHGQAGPVGLCNVWVDIPYHPNFWPTYATDARYDFWDQNNHWLGWPGHTVNQADNLGNTWILLAHHLNMKNVTTLTVTLSNKSHDSGRVVGAGAMRFQCGS